MDPINWGSFQSNSTVGTSELFSSTFAVLSGETSQPYQQTWMEPKTMNNYMHQTLHDPNIPSIIPGLYDPAIDNPMNRFDTQPIAQYRMYDTQPSYLMPHYSNPLQQAYPMHDQLNLHLKQQLNPSLPVTTPLPMMHIQTLSPQIIKQEDKEIKPETPNNFQCGPLVFSSRRPSSASSSALSPRDGSSGSPSNDMISTDLDGPDDVRVMCLACKGVYPSRRSLTGHIGRNEKCREIIEGISGRNYLDQVAAGANPIAPGTENALKAGALTNGQDGLSPICPFCDRFISHYKGNIRRHINQCGKNTGPRKARTEKEREREKRKRKRLDEGPPPILHEGFEPTGNGISPYSQQPHISYLPTMNDDSMNSQVSLPSDPSPPNHTRKEVDPPEDAYICGQCEFVTIYKGNMKRHLNTCHPAPDCKDLKEWDRKLESMRASSLGITRQEMLDKLEAHKLNSTRGRKPRSKNTQPLPKQQQMNNHGLQAPQPMMGIPDYAPHPIYTPYDMVNGYL